MSRALCLLFAGIAYAIFFATFLYLVCFVGNLPFAPVTVDHGPESPLAVALVVDVALIAIFGLQHSVMARQGFKKAWTRIVPEQLERSVYVLAASAALIVMFLFWRPIRGTVWEVGGVGPWLRTKLAGLVGRMLQRYLLDERAFVERLVRFQNDLAKRCEAAANSEHLQRLLSTSADIVPAFPGVEQGFIDEAEQLHTRLQAAVQATPADCAALAAALKPVGETCQSCHQKYR